jgi:hypothetical protein
MVVVAAAAAVLLMVVVAAAAAVLLMVVVVTTVAMGIMAMVLLLQGMNGHLRLVPPGDAIQLRQQPGRVFCFQPQLLGRKHDHRLLHLRQLVHFCLHLGSAIGTTQILYVKGHFHLRFTSLVFIYEQSFICIISIEEYFLSVNLFF